MVECLKRLRIIIKEKTVCRKFSNVAIKDNVIGINENLKDWNVHINIKARNYILK